MSATLRRPGLATLPEEILCYILSYLEAKDLLSCTETCSALWKTVGSSSRLKFTLELAAQNMVETGAPSNQLSCSARLRRLKESVEGWKYLEWRDRHAVETIDSHILYDIAGGIYANGSGRHFPMRGPVRFIPLPDVSSPLDPLAVWTHEHPVGSDEGIMDFCIDPCQDLWVIVSFAPYGSDFVYHLNLITMSTNEPHPDAPLAVRPWLVKDHNLPLDGGFTHFRKVQVCKHIVAALACNGHGIFQTHIWNWKSNSERALTLHHEHVIASDFCLLSPTIIVVADLQGDLSVFTFGDPASETPSAPAKRGIFFLPPLSHDWSFVGVRVSCNPTCDSCTARTDPNQSGNSATPFQVRPEDRLLLCSFTVWAPGYLLIHSLVTRSQLFFDACSRSVPIPNAVMLPQTVCRWPEWGPENSRWFVGKDGSLGLHSVHGYRTVCQAFGTESRSRNKRIVVRDFNPAVLKETETRSRSSRSTRVISEPSFVRRRMEFYDPVETRLPYRETFTDESFRTDDVLLDDTRIIMMPTEDPEDRNTLQVLVF